MTKRPNFTPVQPPSIQLATQFNFLKFYREIIVSLNLIGSRETNKIRWMKNENSDFVNNT